MNALKMSRLIAAGLAFGVALAAPVAAQVPATTIPIGTKVGESSSTGGVREPWPARSVCHVDYTEARGQSVAAAGWDRSGVVLRQ
jgi:hypothetical protein